MKFKKVLNTDGQHYGWKFYCPGCAQWDEPGDGRLHQVHVVDRTWAFSGDADAPTLSPSVLVTGEFWHGGVKRDMRCHSFVREGKIQFLNDCSHALAGQTVDLLEID